MLGEVADVVRAEEAQGSLEQVSVVLAPRHSAATAEGIGDQADIGEGGSGDLHPSGGEQRVVLAGEGEGLFGSEAEATGGRVILRVAAGRLGGEPLSHVAQVGSGALGELLRSAPAAIGHGLVKADTVADEHGGGVQHRAEVCGEAADELLQLAPVYLGTGVRVGCGHRASSLGSWCALHCSA